MKSHIPDVICPFCGSEDMYVVHGSNGEVLEIECASCTLAVEPAVKNEADDD